MSGVIGELFESVSIIEGVDTDLYQLVRSQNHLSKQLRTYMVQPFGSRGHRAAKLSLANGLFVVAVTPTILAETLTNTAMDILIVNTEMVVRIDRGKAGA